MLADEQQHLNNTFYECVIRSGHNIQRLDSKAPLGLATFYAMSSYSCSAYRLTPAHKAWITKAEPQEVLSNAMAVTRGEKPLQSSAMFSH